MRGWGAGSCGARSGDTADAGVRSEERTEPGMSSTYQSAAMDRREAVEVSADPSAERGSKESVPSVAPEPSAPSDRFLRLIPRDFARAQLIISAGSFQRDGVECERLVVSERTYRAAVFNVGVRLGVPVEITIGHDEQIASKLDEAYSSFAQRGETEARASSDTVSEPEIDPGEIDHLVAEADRDLLSTQGKGPIVRLVDAILFEALLRGASDVHVQPLSDRTLVRCRVDGVLQTVRDLPSGLAAGVVSRIKVMGRMDIAERRVPQDGRASVRIGGKSGSGTRDAGLMEDEGGEDRAGVGGVRGNGGGRSIDLRISTLPTSYGERAVIRLLESSRGAFMTDLGTLGMPDDVRRRFESCVSRPNGIVLVTGPTGSGKTTTLYSVLRVVAGTARGGDAGALNIMTVEDPIEYELSTVGLAVSQSQVNTKKGVTFATGLRHILRQDPDVIMVGEIRDAETARVAVQSSLTGHMVLSTLHTNDAAGAITRLIDLGVEPYLVAASLEAVLAQRLVRLLCSSCGGKGCDACHGVGFKGRTGLYELLSVSEPVRELIGSGAPLVQIRSASEREGMRSLLVEGLRLASEGRTTRGEVARAVKAEDTLLEGGTQLSANGGAAR